MDETDIIKEAFMYPFENNNIKNLILVTVIFFIISLFGSLMFVDDYYDIPGIVLLLSSLILLVGSIFISGYYLSVTRDTLNGSDLLPEVNPSLNITDGLKNFVVTFVYSIPLLILLVIFLFFTFMGIYSTYYYYSSDTSTYGVLMLVVLLLMMVYSIFVMFFLPIAQVRLVETNSISEAFGLRYIYNKISQIGWLKCFIIYLLLIIISAIIYFISALFSEIPYIGFIIELIFVAFIPVFLQIFTYRAVALLYRDTLNDSFNGHNPNNPYYNQGQVNYNQQYQNNQYQQNQYYNQYPNNQYQQNQYQQNQYPNNQYQQDPDSTFENQPNFNNQNINNSDSNNDNQDNPLDFKPKKDEE